MLYLTFFCFVTLLVYSLFVFRHERKQKLKQRISVFMGSDSSRQAAMSKDAEAKDTEQAHLALRLFYVLWRELKRMFKRTMPGAKEAKIEIVLLQAGRPFNMTPVDFRILQMSLFIMFPVIAGAYGVLLDVAIGGLLMLALIGLLLAFLIPHYYLKQKIKVRSAMALRELPDVLDLLTVSLEAGLGFDSALAKLISKKHGVLASEFHRCLEEIRLGKTRREALTGVRDRIVVDEIRALISSILQAEKLGIGMVQVLRVQSQEVREQRKQRAEEAAMKAPIKMMFPLVLFIFPSLFIVLLGPAVIQFIETFSK
jgi:tight adherence protein C